MRSYEVVIADEALVDVREVAAYIAYSLGAPKPAARFLDDFEKAVTSLATLPNRHEVVSVEPWKSRGLRHMTRGKYTVLYQADDKTGKVTIMRVLYASGDFQARL